MGIRFVIQIQLLIVLRDSRKYFLTIRDSQIKTLSYFYYMTMKRSSLPKMRAYVLIF
jgi:hypothetical protein